MRDLKLLKDLKAETDITFKELGKHTGYTSGYLRLIFCKKVPLNNTAFWNIFLCLCKKADVDYSMPNSWTIKIHIKEK